MSDLYIDGAMLDRVKQNFGHIEDLLNRPAKTMRNIDSSQIGQDDLKGRVQDFGDEWGYGIGQLGKFSGSVVEALQSIADAFDDVETKLSDALNNAKKD